MTDGNPNAARRRILRFGLIGMAGLVTGPALAALPRTRPRTISLRHLHTGETLRVPYWTDGRYEPQALAQLNRLLRDFRTGEEYSIDPRLFDLLHALQRRLDTDQPYNIVSAYRSPRTNAMLQRTGSGGVARRSLHMQGMAIDIRVPGRSTAQVNRAARSLKAGGVGYYPKSGFVHVDTGRVRFW